MSDPRATFYDGIADTFDEVMDRYDLDRRLWVVFDRLLRDVPLAGRRVLDAGCGTGHFSARAAAAGARVVSLDIGPRLVARARARAGSEGVVSDATRLGLRDGAFDVVLSSEMIEHTPDPRRAVAELVRALRPGGTLVLTCPNAAWRWSLTVAEALRLRPYHGLENWPSWRALRRWLREEGVAIEEMRGVHLLPFQARPLRPALRALDRLGRSLGPLCVNMAVRGVRR